MKAYQAWDAGSFENVSTVVFADTAQAAKTVAWHSETCENAEYIDVRVRRLPQMDGHDRGRSEIDWNDPEDRKALVALGWACFETSWECDTCPEKSACHHWESEERPE